MYNDIKDLLKNIQWKKTGSLIVPEYSVSKKNIKSVKPLNKGFAIYLPHSEIFGSILPEELVISFIKKYAVSESIASASKLEVTLENHGHFNKEIQIGLTYRLFPKSLASRINTKIIYEQDRFVFFEHQLLNVIKLSLLHGNLHRRKNFQNKKVFSEYLEKVVLGITDHLEKKYMSEQKLVKDNKQKEIDLMISMVIRNMYFNSSEQFRYLLARYFQLFFILPRNKTIKKSPNYIDLNKLCKKVTSFSLQNYFALGLAIMSHYLNANIRKGQLNPNDFFINKLIFFKEIKISNRTAIRFLNRLALTTKLFRKEFPIELMKTKNLYYSFILMRQKPLIRVNNHFYFPAGLRFLKEKLTIGIFWDLLDSLNDENKNKLFRFFGELFEKYVRDVFFRIYRTSSLLAKICYFEKEYYDKHSKKVKTSDVMICYTPEAVFIEANASRLRMIDTAIIGDIEAFRKDLEKIIYQSAKQLNRVIHDFYDDRFDLEGIGAKHIKLIYPVILTLTPIPQADLIWISEIEKNLKLKGYLQHSKITQLQLIDAEEMEIIEGLAKKGISFIDILKGKINDRDYVFKPMKNYLYARITNKVKSNYSNRYLLKKFSYVFKLTKNILFGVPLSKAISIKK